MSILRAAGHRRLPWTNGGGWTTEIIAVPNPQQWNWRVSIADVESAGPFSRFDGVDRTIALLAGAGFALTIDGEPPVGVHVPFRPLRFDGGADTTCSLVDGPVQDLNLMVRRGTIALRLDFLAVDDRTRLNARFDTELVVVVAGAIELGDDVLQPFDAFRPEDRPCDVSPQAGRSTAVLAVIRRHTG